MNIRNLNIAILVYLANENCMSTTWQPNVGGNQLNACRYQWELRSDVDPEQAAYEPCTSGFSDHKTQQLYDDPLLFPHFLPTLSDCRGRRVSSFSNCHNKIIIYESDLGTLSAKTMNNKKGVLKSVF